jgi:hypothetical protein
VSHGPGVIVETSILDGQPIRAISWLEPEQPWDSGYAVWCSDPDEIGETRLVHLDCFLDDHPEVGRGMDLARRRSVLSNRVAAVRDAGMSVSR